MRHSTRFPAPLAFRLRHVDKALLDALARREGLTASALAREFLMRSLRRAEADALVTDAARRAVPFPPPLRRFLMSLLDAAARTPPRARRPAVLRAARRYLSEVGAQSDGPTADDRRVLGALLGFVEALIDKQAVRKAIQELTAPASHPTAKGEQR